MLRFIVCGLCFAPCAALYAQNAKLNVPADVTTQTVILDPQASAPTAVEGRLYYDNTNNQPYYYNGTLPWRPFGAGGGKTVATKIVAASNSLDASRADYQCDSIGNNDQVEIQQAIDDLTTGGAVYLLEGTYNISDAINLSSNTALIGVGRGTVLKAVSDLVPSLNGVIKASNASGILISQLMIDGNIGIKSSSDNHGIEFTNVNNSQINQVWIENISGTGQSGPETGGIFFNNSDDNIVSGNYLQSNGYAGIFLNAASDNNNLLGNNIQLSGCDGIYLGGSFNNTVSGNIARSNGCDGIYLRNSSDSTISGNTSQLNTNRGILVHWNSDNNTVSGNIADTNGLDGIALTVGTGGSPENNTVSGNNVMFNQKNGIFLETSSNNTIFGNTIYDNGGTGDDNGIRLRSGSDDNLVSSNLLYDSDDGTGYPINISSSSTNNYLVSNFISSWPESYNKINDSGGNTRYTDKLKVSFEAGNYTITGGDKTLTPQQPTSFLRLNPTASLTLGDASNDTIADGKSAGDILIIENISTNNVDFNDDYNVQLGASSRQLTQNDTLTLIWNGTDWIETGLANNN